MNIPRKAIHIQVSEDMHIAFRKACIENHVTMQEILEFFIVGILDNDEETKRIFDRVVKTKRNKTIKRLSKVEANTIYDAIGEGE